MPRTPGNGSVVPAASRSWDGISGTTGVGLLRSAAGSIDVSIYAEWRPSAGIGPVRLSNLGADDHLVAVGIKDAGDALTPRLVGRLLRDRHVGRAQAFDHGIAVIGVDPQADRPRKWTADGSLAEPDAQV